MHRILLLGTGGIAGHHVEEFAGIAGCSIVACVDQVPGRAAAFAAVSKIGDSFESLEAAIAWGQFDAAINATPDGAHMATTLALLGAGKHVFCEKPLAPNHADALDMTEAAEAAGVINMVNLTYRNSPAIHEARRMVQAGEIGALRHVEASYRQSWLVSKSWGDWRVEDKWLWRLSSRHGSTGVLGDVGIHILDFATYGADQDIVSLHADLVTFPKAEGERIGDYVLDANDSDSAAQLRRARHDRGEPLHDRPRQRSLTGPARNQGRHQGRDGRQGIQLVRLPGWGCRSAAQADAGAARCQAQRPALCRRARRGPQRRSVVPARRRHAEADRRSLREFSG